MYSMGIGTLSIKESRMTNMWIYLCVVLIYVLYVLLAWNV